MDKFRKGRTIALIMIFISITLVGCVGQKELTKESEDKIIDELYDSLDNEIRNDYIEYTYNSGKNYNFLFESGVSKDPSYLTSDINPYGDTTLEIVGNKQSTNRRHRGSARGKYKYLIDDDAKLELSLGRYEIKKVDINNSDRSSYELINELNRKDNRRAFDIKIGTYFNNIYRGTLQQWAIDATYTIIYDFDTNEIVKSVFDQKKF